MGSELSESVGNGRTLDRVEGVAVVEVQHSDGLWAGGNQLTDLVDDHLDATGSVDAVLVLGDVVED